MNKPAPKEPSMDEILSSIRQIIADDDAGGAPKRPAGLGGSPLVQPAPPVRPALNPMAAARPAAPEPEPEPEIEAEAEPLALSAAQILSGEDEAPEPMDFSDVMAGMDDDTPPAFSGAAELIDPEDVAFESDPEPEMAEEEDPMAMFSVEADPEPELEPEPMMEMPRVPPTPVNAAAPRPVAPQPPPASPRPQPRPSVAQTAPMPDPTLSSDMAEELLDTTTQAAVKNTFSRLNSMSLVGSGVTIEDMMREMLRPMLKEWLDENLPSVVERMVEREISRISRGGGN